MPQVSLDTKKRRPRTSIARTPPENVIRAVRQHSYQAFLHCGSHTNVLGPKIPKGGRVRREHMFHTTIVLPLCCKSVILCWQRDTRKVFNIMIQIRKVPGIKNTNLLVELPLLGVPLHDKIEIAGSSGRLVEEKL